MFVRCTLVFVGLMSSSIPAFADATETSAEAPAVKQRTARRRVGRHDLERSKASKVRGHVHELAPVEVYGRRQRPLASVETSSVPFHFPLGTARYSERDRRFLKPGDRW